MSAWRKHSRRSKLIKPHQGAYEASKVSSVPQYQPLFQLIRGLYGGIEGTEEGEDSGKEMSKYRYRCTPSSRLGSTSYYVYETQIICMYLSSIHTKAAAMVGEWCSSWTEAQRRIFLCTGKPRTPHPIVRPPWQACPLRSPQKVLQGTPQYFNMPHTGHSVRTTSPPLSGPSAYPTVLTLPCRLHFPIHDSCESVSSKLPTPNQVLTRPHSLRHCGQGCRSKHTYLHHPHTFYAAISSSPFSSIYSPRPLPAFEQSITNLLGRCDSASFLLFALLSVFFLQQVTETS